MDGLEYCEDLSTLPELADSALLTCLEQRYRKGKVQSTVGTVLLSVRPTLPQAHLPHSHLHQLAARVGRGMADHLEDQAILLYGQPGAGKTDTAHELLKLLLSSLPGREGIRERVLNAAQLVEAFLPSEAQGLVVTSLFYDPNCEQISGAEFSFLLPDLQHLAKFQVFQWMRCGMIPSDLASLGLSPSSDGPSHKFPALEKALRGLGCPASLQEGLFAMLAAVAHLLNLNDREAARLLGCSHETLQKLLEYTTSDCVARYLYAHLLRWLVGWLNDQLKGGAQDCRLGLVDPPCPPRDRTGGGVCQLIRGYITEVLHNIYCLRVFDWEQEQYVEEGVDWESIVVEYNQPLQDTFEQPEGLLESLNCSSAEELVGRVVSCCTLTPNVCYTGEGPGEFIVAHYSGECTYHIDASWCDLNNELPSEDLSQWLSSSSNPVTQQLAQSVVDHSPDLLLGDSPSPCSLSDRVRWGMKALTSWVTTSNPHFVLCIAPTTQQGGEFDGGLVLHQLQQLRVLDTALIQSCGYPVHMSYSTFTQQYGVLLLRGTHLEASRETCQRVLETTRLEEWRLGKSQVFLKPWHLDQLERAVTMYQMSARKLQQAFRRHFLHSNSDLQKHVLNTFVEYEDEEEDDSTDTLSPSDSPPLPPPRPEHTLSIDDPGEEEEEGDVYLTLLAATPQTRAANHTVDKCSTVGPSHKSHSPTHTIIPTQHSPAHTVTQHPPAHKPDSQEEFPSATHQKKPSWGRSENRPTSKQQPPPVEEPNKSQMWFHGKVSRSAAETRLKSMAMDCFLIRESENRVGEFALSVKHQGAVKHFRIDTKRGSGRRRFELFGAQHSFPSLSSLVGYYQEHSISSGGEVLQMPCPLEGSGIDVPPQLPPRRKGLSTIRRPKPTIPSPLPMNETSEERRAAWGTYRPMSLGDLPNNPDKANPALQYSDKVIAALQKELDIEQRIVEAARRMAELPTSSKKERTKRRQSLQQAQAKFLSLRQQYHTLQERRRFLEMSMRNVLTTRRVSEPPPLPRPRH